MQFLVLEHSPIDHLGILAKYLRTSGIRWHSVKLYEGESIPSLTDFDALIVMGGPQQVSDLKQFPWLISEKSFIRTAIKDNNKPVLGICLGAQLIADVMGGNVGPMTLPEIGILNVEKRVAAEDDSIFKRFPESATVFQWHLNEVNRLPSEAIHLMSSSSCKFQAFRVGRLVYGLQFHVEVTPDMVRATDHYPEYVMALEAQKGRGALDKLVLETELQYAELDQSASLIYHAFVDLVRT